MGDGKKQKEKRKEKPTVNTKTEEKG